MTKTVIALGFFDGVHIAHQEIISRAVRFARDNSLTPVALSFDRSPLEILSCEKVCYISSPEEKIRLIENSGANAEFLPLSKELLCMSPEEFVRDILVGEFNISHAVCGYNYHFGKNGDGDTVTLCNLGKKYGFSTEVCDEITLGNEIISSSNIRMLLKNGNVALANKLLGYNFSIQGKVIEGKHLGKSLGFPTANVFFEENRLSPLCGVYKTFVTVNGIRMPAITNVGINPTVGGEKMRSETYIPDFSEDIYGKEIKIEFVDFIREEKKFANIDELKSQIKKDVEGGCV